MLSEHYSVIELQRVASLLGISEEVSLVQPAAMRMTLKSLILCISAWFPPSLRREGMHANFVCLSGGLPFMDFLWACVDLAQEAELDLSELASADALDAKIDRPARSVAFGKPKTDLLVLEEWSSSLSK